jgi:hypothetical protein
MNIGLPDMMRKRMMARAVLSLAAVTFLSFSSIQTLAQKRFKQTYPARKNVRLVLKNSYGTVQVEAWNRDEIRITADMDTPVARLLPESDDDSLVINVVRDNRGRDDIGEVNFKVWVPVNSTVDIETRRGQITVSGVQGQMVRAKVWLGGDIDLTGIRAARVMAENGMGNILFDGELQSGGVYEFTSRQGNINIRIPTDSAFRLVAAAPMSRSITLNGFANAGLNFLGDGRKVVGNVGDGRASLTITNFKGSITFIPR